MVDVLLVFEDRVRRPDGAECGAQVCGRMLDSGQWEGWIEFFPLNSKAPASAGGEGAQPLRTPRETMQPSRRDLVYWATGLTHTFLEGALARALHSGRSEVLGRGPGPGKPTRARPGRPAAPTDRELRRARPDGSERPAPGHAVLDPFEVYAQGADVLRQELGALSPQHLRVIARAFGLTPRSPEELSRLTAAELRREILDAVADRFRGAAGASAPSAFPAPPD